MMDDIPGENGTCPTVSTLLMNGIIRGSHNSVCPLCERLLLTTDDAVAHIDTEEHKRSIIGSSFVKNFRCLRIVKLSCGYTCLECGVVIRNLELVRSHDCDNQNPHEITRRASVPKNLKHKIAKELMYLKALQHISQKKQTPVQVKFSNQEPTSNTKQAQQMISVQQVYQKFEEPSSGNQSVEIDRDMVKQILIDQRAVIPKKRRYAQFLFEDNPVENKKSEQRTTEPQTFEPRLPKKRKYVCEIEKDADQNKSSETNISKEIMEQQNLYNNTPEHLFKLMFKEDISEKRITDPETDIAKTQNHTQETTVIKILDDKTLKTETPAQKIQVPTSKIFKSEISASDTLKNKIETFETPTSEPITFDKSTLELLVKEQLKSLRSEQFISDKSELRFSQIRNNEQKTSDEYKLKKNLEPPTSEPITSDTLTHGHLAKEQVKSLHSENLISDKSEPTLSKKRKYKPLEENKSNKKVFEPPTSEPITSNKLTPEQQVVEQLKSLNIEMLISDKSEIRHSNKRNHKQRTSDEMKSKRNVKKVLEPPTSEPISCDKLTPELQVPDLQKSLNSEKLKSDKSKQKLSKKSKHKQNTSDENKSKRNTKEVLEPPTSEPISSDKLTPELHVIDQQKSLNSEKLKSNKSGQKLSKKSKHKQNTSDEKKSKKNIKEVLEPPTSEPISSDKLTPELQVIDLQKSLNSEKLISDKSEQKLSKKLKHKQNTCDEKKSKKITKEVLGHNTSEPKTSNKMPPVIVVVKPLILLNKEQQKSEEKLQDLTKKRKDKRQTSDEIRSEEKSKQVNHSKSKNKTSEKPKTDRSKQEHRAPKQNKPKSLTPEREKTELLMSKTRKTKYRSPVKKSKPQKTKGELVIPENLNSKESESNYEEIVQSKSKKNELDNCDHKTSGYTSERLLSPHQRPKYDSINKHFIVLKEAAVDKYAWNGFVDTTCALCDEDVDDRDEHIIKPSHAIKVIQNVCDFGQFYMYRKLEDEEFYCVTCSEVYRDVQKPTHCLTKEHAVCFYNAKKKFCLFKKKTKTLKRIIDAKLDPVNVQISGKNKNSKKKNNCANGSKADKSSNSTKRVYIINKKF